MSNRMLHRTIFFLLLFCLNVSHVIAGEQCRACVRDKLKFAGEKITLGAGAGAASASKLCGGVMFAIVGASITSAQILMDVGTCAETCKAEAIKSRDSSSACESLLA